MQCELCGRDCECRPATVDGVRMVLCPGCMRHGQSISVAKPSPAVSRTPVLERIKRPREKDVYKDMDKELVSNFNELIKDARKKKDWAAADDIRKELDGIGFEIQDTDEGSIWRKK